MEFKVQTNSYIDTLMIISPPIKKQFTYSENEHVTLDREVLDYLGEDSHSSGILVQKYPNRALMYISENCAALCRHCTRKRKVGQNTMCNSDIIKEVEKAVKELNKRPQVEDLLLSGGDPFMLPKKYLTEIIKYVSYNVKYVKTIRIGTRVPVTLPTRIFNLWTRNDFIKYYNFGVKYINVQFNHPREITAEAMRVIGMIKSAGITVCNQTVLLKGVNDNYETLRELNMELYHIGVLPYYIYSCDLIPGMSHFRVSIKRALKMYNKLRGNITGMAVPLFIMDLPDGMGKVPANPPFVVEIEDGVYKCTNYEGRTYIYYDKEVTVDEY